MHQRTHSSPSYRSAMAHTHTVYTLLLSAFITGCVCGSDLTVWQSPAIINTTEGQPVNISCHFTVRSTVIRLKVAWVRNNKTEVQHDPYNISALRSQSVNSSTVSHTSVLQLPSVRLNDSGIYYCKVWEEMPKLGESVYGSGTELRVELLALVNNTTTTNPVIVRGPLAFGAVLIIACISAVLCILYKCCRKRPKVEVEGQPVQVEDEGSVLYAALNILKPEARKNTQETRPEPEQSTPDCVTDSEVLYSGVHLKPQKQKHTALSDKT